MSGSSFPSAKRKVRNIEIINILSKMEWIRKKKTERLIRVSSRIDFTRVIFPLFRDVPRLKGIALLLFPRFIFQYFLFVGQNLSEARNQSSQPKRIYKVSWVSSTMNWRYCVLLRVSLFHRIGKEKFLINFKYPRAGRANQTEIPVVCRCIGIPRNIRPIVDDFVPCSRISRPDY